MNKEIKLKVKRMLSKILEVKLSELSDDANPSNISNWDSLNQLKISIEIEKQINRKLTTEEILSLDSVKNIISLVANNYKSWHVLDQFGK